MVESSPLLPRPDGFMSAAYWDNMIYLLGGRIYKKQVVAYNITNNSFTDYGQNVLSDSHISWGQSYTQLNNLFFKFGPTSLAGNKLVIYDLIVLSFWNSPTIIMSPVNVFDEPCLAINDDYLFVIGGIASSIEVLNLSNYSWIEGISKPNNNRARSSCIIDNDNKLYAVGGLDGGNILSSIERIQVTDIKQNSWHYIGDLTEVAYGIRSILFGHFIYVLGGYNSNGGQNMIHTVHTINTITASVTLSSDTLSNPALATVIVDGVFYGFGGTTTQSGTQDLDTWIRYKLPNITTFYTPFPSTNNPTTYQPTTIDPTTSNPTTSNPTTISPTTDEPTTSVPTTDIPTTARPTTSLPTTSLPTTSLPTITDEPTTSAPSTDIPTAAIETTTFIPTTSLATTNELTMSSLTTNKTQYPTFDPTKEPTVLHSSSKPSADPESEVPTATNSTNDIQSAQPTSIPTPIYDDLLFICYYNGIRDYIDTQYAQIMAYQVLSSIISLTSVSWIGSEVKSLEICKIFSDTRLSNKCPSFDVSTQVNAQYVAIGLLTITSGSQLDEYRKYVIDLLKWNRFREEFNINMNKAFIHIDATNEVTTNPSFDPSKLPTSNPSNIPTTNPSNNPTTNPSMSPTTDPTKFPTSNPSNIPTSNPSNIPTTNPTMSPTPNPSCDPTKFPTSNPSNIPTKKPTKQQDRRRNLLTNSFEAILIDIVDLNNITVSDGSGSGNNEENKKYDNTLIIIIVIVIVLCVVVVITAIVFYYYRQKKIVNKETTTDTKMTKEIEMNEYKQEEKMKEGMEGNLYETPRAPPKRVNDIDQENGNDEYVAAPIHAVKSNEESEDSLDIIQHQMLSQEINEYEDKITAGQ